MADSEIPESQPPAEPDESFDDILSQYERSRSRRAEPGKGLEGTVIAVSADSVFLDIGFKTEGILPLADFASAGETVQPGDKLPVTIKGRDPEGYYQLARGRIERPRDWSSLEKAFTEKTAIAGTVTGVVKGGVSVDVGVRAFMPASRSGARDAAELEKLVGQDIRCRIIKLDVTDEDVVVDRRAVAEEEERATKERRFGEIKEGETVRGEVRSLTDYGAFVDIGGVDGLLHVGDISWGRVNKPSDVLSPGQQIEVKVLKVDHERRRISLGLKQFQADPWESAADRYRQGERVRGAVTRLADFGAFVELEPGIEGLIHLSEMSWSKKARKPGDVVKPGETVEAVVLAVNAGERRISLGLKQALGDPWVEVTRKFPVGSAIEGPVTSLTKFGAFVQLAEGIEGMIHISDISAEKRLNHPGDLLRVGQPVRAQVLEIDTEKRRLKLGMKQLLPTSLEEYIGEHKPGDVVTGRIVEIAGGLAQVELGEGIHGTCRVSTEPAAQAETGAPAAAKPDLSSLSSMLQARWKGGAASSAPKREEARAGQVRSFRIARLDAAAKKIDLELVE
ncbi:MAG: 30S ribosomal protein S1 [Candidatus Korobacteraceae bacterium]